ncbi:hypothetical protein SDC9_201821 [bioreactor metagenome]|uniref:Uncharacterized protein n=1 Tax=bioreactor metagenome TaxID=1076179 RepID=A0A645ITH5_9ZZZZ
MLISIVNAVIPLTVHLTAVLELGATLSPFLGLVNAIDPTPTLNGSDVAITAFVSALIILTTALQVFAAFTHHATCPADAFTISVTLVHPLIPSSENSKYTLTGSTEVHLMKSFAPAT